jgi:signal transduction histidine kinase
LQAHEDEHRRIAAYLHDDLGQQLALVAVTIDRLRQQVPTSSSHIAEGMLEVLQHTQAIAAQVQRLSQRLHPSRLEHLGVVPTLRALCEGFAGERHMTVQFTAHDLPPIGPDAALALFRITEEALRNVAQHSETTSATVTLSVTADHLRLTIADRGRGLDKIRGNTGIGLATMQQRVKAIGGRLVITSAPAAGMRIDAVVPVQPSHSAGGERTSPETGSARGQ